MLPDDRLWAVVWQHDPSKIVLETGAPFDDKLEPAETYGDLNARGWMVVPLTAALEQQYREAVVT